MTLEVKLFAVAKQLAGTDVLTLELPARATVADLRAALVEKVPGLAKFSESLSFAVNRQYARDDVRLELGADVACIPPVSGG